jgi:hypothetical protein
MNVPELVIWLIPGYIALRLYFTVNPLRSKQGYEWFFQTAAAGMLCFVLARVVVLILHSAGALLPCIDGYCVSSSVVRDAIFRVARFPYSATFVVGVLVAPAIGALLCAVRPRWVLVQRWFKRRFTESSSGDLLYYACRQLEQERVLVTLDNGKVYVGFLVDFTSDPDEPEKYIKILPIMSGHRDDETFKVRFTTPYLPYSATVNTTPQEMIIPVKRLTTFARFDESLHNWFISSGLTIMDLPPE